MATPEKASVAAAVNAAAAPTLRANRLIVLMRFLPWSWLAPCCAGATPPSWNRPLTSGNTQTCVVLRQKFHYSDTGFVLLGRIVERDANIVITFHDIREIRRSVVTLIHVLRAITRCTTPRRLRT